MNTSRSADPSETAEGCRQALIAEVIDGLEFEPIRRQIGAGFSEAQWCRTQINCRYTHCYIDFPSPLAKLAGLDDSIIEHYTVFTGSVCRDDVPGAEVLSGCEDEDDNLCFLKFPTLEEAVVFCLKDEFAPMDIELYRNRKPDPAPEGGSGPIPDAAPEGQRRSRK